MPRRHHQWTPSGGRWTPSGGRARMVRLLAATGLLLLAAPLLAGTSSAQDAATPRVLTTTVTGAVTPVLANHLRSGIQQAADEGYAAYVVELDTPGGLDTSMRAIVQDLLASEVPVAVFISPQGARGASAGAIIAMAAHVAAMAPGTTIGAATPVAGDTGENLDAKIINDAAAYAESLAQLRGRNVEFIVDAVREGRSAGADEALELGAIDLIAASTTELLDEVDGSTVNLGTIGRQAELDTAGAILVEHDLGVLRTVQQFLADPNIAFLLMSIGTLGLVYELASPGLGVGGALGLTFILLGLFGLAVLPVNLVGVLFLALAAALFVAEVLAPGLGLAAAGGALSLLLAGVFLIDDAPGVSVSLLVVLPTAVVVAGFVVFAGRFAMRLRTMSSTTTGPGLLVGAQGPIRLNNGTPQLFTQGAWWIVRPRDPGVTVAERTTVRVVDVDGLQLVVDPVDPASPGPIDADPSSSDPVGSSSASSEVSAPDPDTHDPGRPDGKA